MVELLVVISIVAILASIAAPSFQSTMRSINQSTLSNTVFNDLNQVRGEAVKRNRRVLLCPRNAGGTDCAATADWKAGWVACVEDVANVNHCLATSAASPNPFLVRAAINTTLTLVKAGTSTATEPVRFSGNSSGTAATLTVGGTWSGATARVITVAATGNISK